MKKVLTTLLFSLPFILGADQGMKDSIVETFLQIAKNVVNSFRTSESALLTAASDGNVEALEKLLEEGVNLSVVDEDGETPLHLGAMKGHLEIVETLIQNGSDVNIRNNFGNTSLHHAAYSGSLEMVDTLIQNGADVNITNKLGTTALEDAKKKGFLSNKQVISYFKKNFQELNARSKETLRRIAIGHAWNIRGITSLLYKTATNTISSEIKLEGAFNATWFSKLHKDFMEFEELYPQKKNKLIRDTLFFAVEHYETRSVISNEATITRIKQGLPTLISSGYIGHAVTLLIWGDQFVICNRGEMSRRPIEIYHFKNELTLEILKKIASNSKEHYERYVLGKDGLSQELGFSQTELDEELERSSPLPDQTVGNCTWISPNTAIRALVMIMEAREIQNGEEDLQQLLENAQNYDNLRLAFHQISVLQRGLKSVDAEVRHFDLDHTLIQTAMHKAYLLPLDDILSKKLNALCEKYMNSLNANDKLDFAINVFFWKSQTQGSFSDLGYPHLQGIRRDFEISRPKEPTTLLHIAAQKGDLEIVEKLIEKGADIHKKNTNGETPLHYAAWEGHLAIIEKLLEKGADINKKNNFGNTPLHLAIINNQIRVVDKLIEEEIDTTNLLYTGRTDKKFVKIANANKKL